MLQRRGRVIYRTLKRQFQLDDDVREDVQEGLMYGQRLAVDEDGSGQVREPSSTRNTQKLVAHFTQGLAVLQTLPDTLERSSQTLRLQTHPRSSAAGA